TRNVLEWTARFPAIVAALGELPVMSAVLDGEIVAFDAQGRSDFGALQRWLGVGPAEGPEVAAPATQGGRRGSGRGAKVIYQAFDLLYLEGHDLKGATLEDRKALLERL